VLTERAVSIFVSFMAMRSRRASGGRVGICGGPGVYVGLEKRMSVWR
jgi:hypothetical protein